ncbi:AAEL015347-PA [Aedes aegypti]|uniref:AAEL015347-PA n=2 Tax=Aedes aegypti TaxID=7159 RepID=A0A1S4G4M8_AEDAE|nr:zinc finger protein 615 [Aedes aegypti]EAT32441.1 AAEL015347-PA [Aedes aegypti]
MDFPVTIDTCRICLENKSTDKTMSDPYKGNIPRYKDLAKLNTYLDVYEFVAGLGQPLAAPTSASAMKFFPRRICDDCVLQLIAAFEFRRKVQRSEDVLKNLMELYDDQYVETVEVIEECELDIKDDIADTIEYVEDEQEYDYVDEESECDQVEDQAVEDEYEVDIKPIESVQDIDLKNSSNQNDTAGSADKQTMLTTSAIKAKGLRYAQAEKEDILYRGKSLTTQCEDCGKIVSSRYFKTHKSFHQSARDNPKSHVCDICNAQFTLKENLSKHKRIHSNDKRYNCSYCNKKFLHWASRRYHIDRCHTGEKKHVCKICGAGFCNSSQYILHTRRHTGATPYGCKLCDRSFISGQALKFHMLAHSDAKNFPCDVCGKSYKSRKSLRVHTRTLHENEKNYVCPICGHAFSQNHVLRTHLLKNHPDYEPPPPGTIVSVRGIERLRNQAELEPDSVQHPAT